jgi:hypothetical protein
VLTDLVRLAFVRACRPRLVYKNFVLAHTQLAAYVSIRQHTSAYVNKNFVLAHTQLAARKKNAGTKKMQGFFFQT